MTRRGGVLLDLFIIAALLGGGAAAWLAWKRGAVKLPFSLPAPALLSPAPPPAVEPDIDVSDRSSWIQSRCRDVLSKSGVREKHVLKSYNARRQEGGIQWLEDTLELRRPAAFDERGFLGALAPLLAEKRLSVMDDRRESGRWTLSLGDRKRVYQRLVFNN